MPQPASPQQALDYASALKRLGGNQGLLNAVLAKFSEDFQTFPERLQTLFETGQWNELRILTHTLKGSAANISAGRLSGAAAAIESAIKNGEVPVSPELCLVCLDAWQQLAGELDALHGARQAPETVAISMTEMLVRLKRLEALIDSDFAAADAMFLELRQLRVPERYQDDFNLFIKQFDAFDVRAAKSVLARMLGREA
ncbi:Hpt domain-containing protein [Shewanella litorisediminis]|uniref:Hpt domain-containing protein n=1 Tax=Shewanella litorisediminis TaxID=1173586 RepID=A0ABX7G3H5_9GAMM|nr:Hpt domain-containing protein [Shewanella litorisediminis]MCL2917337.1 Hpt domain-containing protein [Shewanella litorisediminis]QRH01805.1 Hpt domain-containing protein [Shewanella litorisediminis]